MAELRGSYGLLHVFSENLYVHFANLDKCSQTLACVFAEDLWRLLEDVGVTKSTHPTLMKKPEELIKHMITKRY